jgi:DNA transposition AAA+ family ATPase
MVTADTAEAPASTESAPYGGATPRGRLAGNRFTIAADKIMAATADMPDRERNALRWAHSYCVAKNLSHADLAAKLKQPSGEAYNKDSLYHAFTGGREASQLRNMVDAIESLKRVEEERAALVDTGYIHTSISASIWRTCRRALLRQRVAFIFGETQIGKTEGLEAYRRVPEHNHGQTKMFRFPAGGAYCDVLREMAIMLGLPTGNSGMDLRRMIINSFDEHMLLIADEIMESQSMTSGSVKRYLRTLNFLREIHDRTKCGLVLCGTNVFRDALIHSKEARNLRQLLFRGLAPLQLPSVLPARDLNLFSKAYNLGPAPDEEVTVRLSVFDTEGRERKENITKNPLLLQNHIAATEGVGRWKLILQEASDLAREGRRPITWGAVIKGWHSYYGDLPQVPAEQEAA